MGSKMDGMAALALLGVAGGLAWMSWRDSLDYAEFKQLTKSADRIRFYLRWTGVPFVLFGLGGLLLLLALGGIGALWELPAEFAELIAPFETASASASSSVDSLLGIGIGMAIALTVSAIIWRNRIKKMSQPVIGDIEALLPRNRREIAACIPLAFNAGISEEIFYRVALPLLVLEVTGSAIASCVISIAAFGMAHWYQGWKGVLATGAVGAFLYWLYLSSGSILKPIIVHIVIDLMALVVRPSIAQYLASKKAASGAFSGPSPSDAANEVDHRHEQD